MAKKKKNIDIELNKKRGKRLQECRNIKGMTQQELADLSGYAHPNSISQLETGERELTWDKAIPLADALDVQADFLMCKTDLVTPIPRYSSLAQNDFDSVDSLFIKTLISKGIHISFVGYTEVESEGEIHITDMNKFVKFSLSVPDSCVILSSTGEQKEFIIQFAMIGTLKISIGKLLFIINRLYDYIDFTFSNLSQFCSDLELCSATDSMVNSSIQERSPGGLFKLQAIQEKLIKDFGENAVLVTDEDDIPLNFRNLT